MRRTLVLLLFAAACGDVTGPKAKVAAAGVWSITSTAVSGSATLTALPVTLTAQNDSSARYFRRFSGTFVIDAMATGSGAFTINGSTVSLSNCGAMLYHGSESPGAATYGVMFDCPGQTAAFSVTAEQASPIETPVAGMTATFDYVSPSSSAASSHPLLTQRF